MSVLSIEFSKRKTYGLLQMQNYYDDMIFFVVKW
jgi:hypothetical protein